MTEITEKTKGRMEKSILALQDELNTIQTGRASAAMFDRIKVDYYGNPTPLEQTATVSVPEARLIIIQPWDSSMLGEIERAIQKSELNVNPSNDGKIIRINIPQLTEERRKELVKMAKSIAEQSRVSVRNIRRDSNDELKKMQKAGDISEDELKRGEDEVQKLTDKYVAEINSILEAKDKQIMEV